MVRVRKNLNLKNVENMRRGLLHVAWEQIDIVDQVHGCPCLRQLLREQGLWDT